MGGYVAYPEYKESNSEWLGCVPCHWKTLRIKRLTAVKRGASPRPIDDPKYFDDEGEYAWVRIADVTDSETYLEKTTQRLSELGKNLSVPLEYGDIFLSIAGSVGKPIITKIKCCIHDGFVYFPNLSENRKFIYYVFASGQPYLGLGKFGTQLNLNTDTVGGIVIGLPPYEEQQTIACFLDYKTAQIDALIAKKALLLKKLAQKRTAIISHAVTKGLDPSAPMKDSGVTWLGEIPAHWSICHMKRLASISYGVGGEIDRGLIEGINLISLPNLTKDGTLLLEDFPFCDLKENEKKEALLQKGDLLFNWRNGSSDHLGKTAYFDHDGEWTHVSFLLKLRFNLEESEPRYFQYMLTGLRFTGFFISSKAGVNNTFNLYELSNLFVIAPPKYEQQRISQYLDKNVNKIDRQRTKIQEAIAKLKEYRTSLITHAVTGKIDVRGFKLYPNQ